MPVHERIDYLEFPAKDLVATKHFFASVFDWEFEDCGSEYTAFSDQGMRGGFFKSEQSSRTSAGSALVVFYSADLESTQTKISDAGGVIVEPIFSFPGGRRFHFTDPSGNEFAVWSDSGL